MRQDGVSKKKKTEGGLGIRFSVSKRWKVTNLGMGIITRNIPRAKTVQSGQMYNEGLRRTEGLTDPQVGEERNSSSSDNSQLVAVKHKLEQRGSKRRAKVQRCNSEQEVLSRHSASWGAGVEVKDGLASVWALYCGHRRTGGDDVRKSEGRTTR